MVTTSSSNSSTTAPASTASTWNPAADLVPVVTSSALGHDGTPATTVFVCSYPGCGKKFPLKGNLKRHQNIHRGDKRFPCPVCGREFLRKADMQVHQRVHTGEKPYACRVTGCGLRFARHSDLLSHERTHSGSKPFACPHPGCDRRFARRFDLHKHQRMHTQGSGRHEHGQRGRESSSGSQSSRSSRSRSNSSDLEMAAAMCDGKKRRCRARPTTQTATQTATKMPPEPPRVPPPRVPTTTVAVAELEPLPALHTGSTSRALSFDLTCTLDHVHFPPDCFTAESWDALSLATAMPDAPSAIVAMGSPTGSVLELANASPSSPSLASGPSTALSTGLPPPPPQPSQPSLPLQPLTAPAPPPWPHSHQHAEPAVRVAAFAASGLTGQTHDVFHPAHKLCVSTSYGAHRPHSLPPSDPQPAPTAVTAGAATTTATTTAASATTSPPVLTPGTKRCQSSCAVVATSKLDDYAAHTACGHLAIRHGDHRDFVVKNHLVCLDNVRSLSGDCATGDCQSSATSAAANKSTSSGGSSRRSSSSSNGEQVPVGTTLGGPTATTATTSLSSSPVSSAVSHQGTDSPLRTRTRCAPQDPHGPGCGHLAVRHRDHIDYVVEDNLFCQHAGLLEDADQIELLGDDFWAFYGAIDSLHTDDGETARSPATNL